MEIILMVGISGSGKTTLTRVAFPDHVRVSLDALRDIPSLEKSSILARHKGLPCCTGLDRWRKMECVLLRDALKARKNVVIDDTNLTRKIRARHMVAAHEYSAVVRAVHFTNTRQAFEYDARRTERRGEGALHYHSRKMEPPGKDEGFEFVQAMSGWLCEVDCRAYP